MSDAISVCVHDLAGTRRLAAALAPQLRAGAVLCLDGELGAGKTAFVHALAAALGAEGEVRSPTFTLENRHALAAPSAGDAPLLVHSDLYRPGDDARRDLLPTLLEARDEGALLAIEWAEPVRDWLTPYLQLTITLVGDGTARRFELTAVPGGWPAMGVVAAAWSSISDQQECA